jgi:hypothetical protein
MQAEIGYLRDRQYSDLELARHLGGEAAAIVPLSDLRRLRAVERRASAEVLEEAEIEATLTAHREWVAAGPPGAVSHEEAMAELLGQ